VRPWLGLERSLDALNRAAGTLGLQTESGKPVRFVPPSRDDAYYELGVYESGRVSTRPDSLHDWLNALAWLAFPRAKARINALHSDELRRSRPLEKGRRGPFRDLLTIFDEGGAVVVCADDELLSLLRACHWKALFLDRRERVQQHLRILVFGHAVLEQALEPWPGITCKALVFPGGDVDRQIADWLASEDRTASPKLLQPLPIFGYPGWSEAQDAAFYDDKRYFRP
jgi:hypothetical protein